MKTDGWEAKEGKARLFPVMPNEKTKTISTCRNKVICFKYKKKREKKKRMCSNIGTGCPGGL